MADPGFNVPITTTTVTNSNTTVQTNIRFDKTYIRTVPGIIKCIVLACNLIVFASVSLSDYSGFSRLSFMSFICGFGLWFTGLLLVFYLFHIIEKFYKIPWLKIEVGYCGLWTLFLLIGSSLSTAYITTSATFGFVAFFGYVNMILYGYDAFLKFQALQRGEIAQGDRVISKTTTSSGPTSPAAY